MIAQTRTQPAKSVRTGGAPPVLARALCAAAGAAIAASATATLFGTVPDIDEHMLTGGEDARPVAIRLLAVPSAAGAVSRSATLVADAGRLRQSDALELILGTYETSAPLRSAELTAAGCSYVAEAGSVLSNNAPVTFRRSGECAGGGGDDSRMKAHLTLTFDAGSARDAQVALWSWQTGAAKSAELTVVDPNGVEHAVQGRWLVRRSGNRISRADLLAFMWELPAAAFWGLVLAALGLLAAGIALTVFPRAQPAAVVRPAALALVVLGTALLYSLLVPPLQAADEPDHLLGWGSVAGRAGWTDDVAAWARRIHFERLKFRSHERFRPVHRERAFETAWAEHVYAEDVVRRSSTAAQSWRPTAPLVPAKPSHALLALRLLNGAILAGAFAFAAWLLSRASIQAAALFGLLLIPTLPMFGMQLSEMTWTVAAYVVLAGAIVAVLGGQIDGRLTALALGLCWALLAGGPRSGWPAVLVVAGLLAGRIVLREGAPKARDTMLFWTLFAVPIVLLFASGALYVPQPEYDQWRLQDLDPRLAAGSMTAAIGTVMLAAACALVERLTARLRVRLQSTVYGIGRVVAAVLGVAVAASVVLSLFVPLPRLGPLEAVTPASAWHYAGSAVAAVATAFRLRGPDFFTWTSLWGAFGWIDRVMPQSVMLAVGCATAIAGVVSLTMASAQRGARAAWMVLVIASLLASVAVYAFVSHGLGRNVHGRYLLGVYIALQAVLWSGVTALGERGRGIAGLVLLAGALALHAYALRFVVLGYFG